jgi:hypothetical protein
LPGIELEAPRRNKRREKVALAFALIQNSYRNPMLAAHGKRRYISDLYPAGHPLSAIQHRTSQKSGFI